MTLLASLIQVAPVAWVEGIETITLRPCDVLVEAGEPVTHLVFPEAGLISVLAAASPSPAAEVEVALLGAGDIIGVAALLANTPSSHRVAVRVGGTAYRVSVLPTLGVLDTCPAARDILLKYAGRTMSDLHAEVAITSRFNVRARLCRRLLQASKLLGTDALAFTHNHLSQALGVRRSTVTVELQELEGEGLIRSTRGVVTIRDAAGLQAQVRDRSDVGEAVVHRTPSLQLVAGARA